MAVRIYSSLDTGAPVLTGTAWARLRQVLLACLVNGYGAKPGAGWSVLHDVTDGFSLGSSDGVINFVRSTDAMAVVYIMESITDGTTALAGGVNRRSAGWSDGSALTERQYLNIPALTLSNVHWVVVADAYTVTIMASGGTTTSDQVEVNYGFAHHFGRYINALGLTGPAAFCSIGGQSSAAAAYLVATQVGMALRNPFTGLIEQGVTPRYGLGGATLSMGATQVVQTRNVLNPSRLMPVRAALVCYGAGLSGNTTLSQSALAGYLRGVIVEPVLNGSKLPAVLALFGISNVWQSRVQPITLPNGQQWVPIWPHNFDGSVFASLASSDWE